MAHGSLGLEVKERIPQRSLAPLGTAISQLPKSRVSGVESNVSVNGLFCTIVKVASRMACFLDVGETALWLVQRIYCILEDSSPKMLALPTRESSTGHFNVL